MCKTLHLSQEAILLLSNWRNPYCEKEKKKSLQTCHSILIFILQKYYDIDINITNKLQSIMTGVERNYQFSYLLCSTFSFAYAKRKLNMPFIF